MKVTKTQLTEMVRKVIREALSERQDASEPGSMSPEELAAHLDGEREKKKRKDVQKQRSAVKATTRGMEECGGDMDDDEQRSRRRLSDVFVDESVNEGLYESPGGLDEFCTAYVEAALWTSSDDADDSGRGMPLDEKYSISDIDGDALAEMQRDCDEFQSKAGEMIDGREAEAGHDFWLTRNGHGAGFWDGDWPEEHEEVLSDLAREFGEVHMYVGDDGVVYSFNG